MSWIRFLLTGAQTAKSQGNVLTGGLSKNIFLEVQGFKKLRLCVLRLRSCYVGCVCGFQVNLVQFGPSKSPFIPSFFRFRRAYSANSKLLRSSKFTPGEPPINDIMVKP